MSVRGDDRVEAGNDVLRGGPADAVRGNDVANGGPGRDFCLVDPGDVHASC